MVIFQTTFKYFSPNHVNIKRSQVVQKDFYIDDLLTGTNNLDQALELQNQLIGMLKSSGMHFRKWTSNSSIILESIPQEDREPSL